METIYGAIEDNSVSEYKKILHSKIHWLLIYKESDDPKFYDYFYSIMKYITALSEVFDNNAIILDLIVTLQVALDESKKESYSHKTYRKYVLDAHNIVDKL